MSKENFYTMVFSNRAPGTFFVKWCWPAFIFGPLWLAYRKCYLYATLFAFVGFLAAHYSFGMYDGLFAYDGTGIYFRTYFGYSLDLNNMNLDAAVAIISHLFLGLFGVSLYGRVWDKTKIPHDRHATIIFILMWIPVKNLLFVGCSYVIYSFTDERPKAVLQIEMKHFRVKNNEREHLGSQTSQIELDKSPSELQDEFVDSLLKESKKSK